MTHRPEGATRRHGPGHRSCVRARGFLATAALLLTALFPAAAQSYPPTAFLSGTVVDAETGDTISNAHVVVVERNEHFVTSEDGAFAFRLPPGRYSLAVEMLGYSNMIEEMMVVVGGTTLVRIALVPEPITVEGVEAIAERATSRFDEVRAATDVLSGAALQRDYRATLAETMRDQAGVAIRSMGPAPARPVIRGLSGDRVVVSEDGVTTHDLSATSPDHAVTVEPFSAEQIEVVRGPEVLLSTSSTFGGVVNIKQNRIARRLPESWVGSFGTYAASANSSVQTSASATVPLGCYAVKADASRLDAGDERTPIGEMANTQRTSTTGSAGISRVGDGNWIGASAEVFDSQYGIPGGFIGGHPQGVDIDMFRRTLSVRGGLDADAPVVRSLEFDAERTYYRHIEYESRGTVGAEFVVREMSGSVRAELHTFGGTSTAKFQFGDRDMKMGGFVFTPPTRQRSVSAAFVQLVGVANAELQASVRADVARFEPDLSTYSAGRDDTRARTFRTWSASVAALYPVTSGITTTLTLSRSSRIPSVEELYNEGPHLAAYTYDVGNPDLDAERGVGVEWLTRLALPQFGATAALFVNDFSNYVTPRNTGRINYAQLLPVYETEGVGARFVGAEAFGRWSGCHGLSVEGQVSWVRAVNIDDDVPLPDIPPLRGTWKLAYKLSNATLGISGEHAADQIRVDTYEAPTDGYSVYGVYASLEYTTRRIRHSVVLSLDNVLNTEYRNHLSRIRLVMPETARNATLNYRLFLF